MRCLCSDDGRGLQAAGTRTAGPMKGFPEDRAYHLLDRAEEWRAIPPRPVGTCGGAKTSREATAATCPQGAAFGLFSAVDRDVRAD